VTGAPRLRVAQLPLGVYQTNCYLAAVEGADIAAVVDPGDDPDAVRAALAQWGCTPAGILVTHGHHDHLGAVAALARDAGVEVWMPRGEADSLRTLAAGPHEPEHLLDGGETVSLAGIEFETTLVPGHSPASIAYHAGGYLFSGDVLFAGSIGRTDFAGGDLGTLLESIGRLAAAYPPDTAVCCGHGPATTLAAEVHANPFLEPLRA
jgi:glyoxylase-like metal-dependent hydrolase (beta-lactamase superfamily II)